MYKDVWKRILAVTMALCLVFTIVDWPVTVKAEDVYSYHTYQYGNTTGTTSTMSGTVVTLYTVDWTDENYAETFDSIVFDVYNASDASYVSGTVSVYYADPDSGITVDSLAESGVDTILTSEYLKGSTDVSDLTEGTNWVELSSMTGEELAEGSVVAVYLSLEEGAYFYAYPNNSDDTTYVQNNGSWTESGDLCAALRMITYAEKADGEDDDSFWNSIFNYTTSLISGEDEEDEGTEDDSALNTGSAYFDKQNVTIPVGGYTEIILNDYESSSVEWSVADTSIVSLTTLYVDTVAIRGLAEGTTTLYAKDGSYTYTCTVTVTPDISSAEVTFYVDGVDVTIYEDGVAKGGSVVYDGGAQTPTLTVMVGDETLTLNTEYTLTCVAVETDDEGNENTSVITIADDNFIDVGTFRFTISGQEPYSGTQEVDFEITARELTDDAVTCELNRETWEDEWETSGDEDLSDYVTVTDTSSGEEKELTYSEGGEEGDYTLALNDDETGIVVTGINNYTGTYTISFPTKLTEDAVTLSSDTYVYTGSKITPYVTVTMDGMELASGDDYEVTYGDYNIDAALSTVGNAPTVTVTGVNEYYGEVTVSFTISAKYLDNSDVTGTNVEVSASTATGSSAPTLTVTYNGNTLTEGTDYKVETPTVSGSTGTVTITGQGNYQGTRDVTYTVVEGSISDIVSNLVVDAVTYTGSALTPDVELQNSEGTAVSSLTLGTDYEISYSNNVNAGTATVTITGIGGYAGSVTGEFTINAVELSTNGDVDYDFDASIEYSPVVGDLQPQVTITYNGNTLVEDTDYTLSYGIDATTSVNESLSTSQLATIMVKGASDDGASGNYTGEYSLTYYIAACELDEAIEDGRITVATAGKTFSYTGSAITPEYTLTYVPENPEENDTTSYQLTKDTDYTITYTDNTDQGTATVTIRGTGRYTDTVTYTFTITAIALENVTVEITDEDVVERYEETSANGGYAAMKWYSTEEDDNKLELTLTNGDTELEEGTNYELTYENIDQISYYASSEDHCIATVTITAKGGNYVGTMEVYYLLAGDLADSGWKVSDNGTYTYTGDEITLDSLTVSSGWLIWKETLEEGEDYTVSYKNNTNAYPANDEAESVGTEGSTESEETNVPTATIEEVDLAELPTANGCYLYNTDDKDWDDSEKLTYTFKISPRDIEEAELTASISKRYDNAQVTLTTDEISLEYNENSLDENDFEVDENGYSNNSKVTTSATATVNGIGNFTGSKEITFTITGKDFDQVVAYASYESAVSCAKLENYSCTYMGSTQTLSGLTLIDYADDENGNTLTLNTDYTVAYENNTDAGTATIVVTGKGNYADYGAEYTFTIKPRNIASEDTDNGTLNVSGVETTYTYTGESIEPTPTVTFTMPDNAAATQMTEDTDYTLTYSGNTDVLFGEGSEDAQENGATITITGTGNYTGETEVNFTISQKNINDVSELSDDITIEDIDTQAYTGKSITPSVTIVYDNGTTDGYTLVQNTDYTLSYANNIFTGTATVTITAIGNFTGEHEVQFQIGTSVADADKVTVAYPELDAGETYTYTGSAITPTVTVTSVTTGGSLTEGTDYEVTYSDNTDAGTATITVTGEGNYAGTVTKEFTIAQKDITDDDVELAIEELTDGSYSTSYTASAITPDVTLTYNESELTAGSDFSVSYSDSTDVGTAYVTVAAVSGGNYTGTISGDPDGDNTAAAQFTITQASLGAGMQFASGYRMTVIGTQALEDGKAEPVPTIYFHGTELVYGTDYTCTYENNTSVGTTAIVYMTGMGNYTGTVYKYFTIKASIADETLISITFTGGDSDDIVWYADWYTESGGSETGIVEDEDFALYYISGDDAGETVSTDDYTISYENNDFVGEVTATFTGQNSLAGETAQNVTVMGKMTDVGAEVTIADVQYTGDVITADEVTAVVTYYGQTLTQGEDYALIFEEDYTDVGTAEILVYGMGYYSGYVSAEFEIVNDTSTLVISGVEDAYTYRGEAIKPEITVTCGNAALTEDTDYTVTYGTNTNVGKGTVIVLGKGTYKGLSQSVTFTITALDVADLAVSSISNQTYTTQEIMPEITVTTSDGYTLTKNVDYTVSYSDNVNVGTATVTITGDDENVTGSQSVTFVIAAKSLATETSTSISVELASTGTTYTYDGTEKEPEVVVEYTYGDSDSDVATLVKNTDYTVAYSNNTDVGTASITITGTGNYTGTRTLTFSIRAYDITDGTVAVAFADGTDSYAYMGGLDVEPEVTVTLDDVKLTNGTDYEISYSNNTAVASATAENAPTVTVTGAGNYTGTLTKTFTIITHALTADDITVEDIANQAYTGSVIVPDVEITLADEEGNTYTLVMGTDYTVAASSATVDTDNTAIGTGEVTITGAGGFSGTVIKTFTIAASIADATVSGLEDSYTYTGSVWTVSDLGITSVQIGDTVLTADDYSLSFAEDEVKDAGTYTLVVTGTGDYGGTAEISFEISEKSIADSDVTMTGFEDTVEYSSDVTQDITLTWGSVTLEEDTDYTVTYTASGGTYTMTVTGTGNYTGAITKTFTVTYTDLSDADITNVSSTYTYTGNAVTPAPIVTLGSETLTEGTDYTVTYSNNTNVTSTSKYATLTVTGAGSYTGLQTVEFTILAKSINETETVKASVDSPQIYTGSDIEPDVTVTDSETGSDVSLVTGTDYTLAYSDNRKVGTGHVTLVGKGNYTATNVLQFYIRPDDVDTATVTAVTSSSATITWSSVDAKTGYVIQRKTEDGSWTTVARTKATTYTDTSLDSGTTYYYRARAYVTTMEDDGTSVSYYSNSWSSTASGTTL